MSILNNHLSLASSLCASFSCGSRRARPQSRLPSFRAYECRAIAETIEGIVRSSCDTKTRAAAVRHIELKGVFLRLKHHPYFWYKRGIYINRLEDITLGNISLFLTIIFLHVFLIRRFRIVLLLFHWPQII
ncbi:Os07g0496500 [Oryza sativa Japonica Group]|uniref:Os07g0496500 protein n=1 Tax=Oryza sativa subsp. japonica TaxID=39947 RepID=A0A0P0X620_ORYSJ|nr:hypothetical protein EE612_039376 [Oryza sativa]BAT01606.1 Os07g0496500 [Oryza sativa Japonica Group]